MQNKLRSVLAWLAGILAIVGFAWYASPQDLGATISAVGVQGFVTWVLLTIVARLLLAETTVLPLRVLGFRLSRAVVFWMSWIRTLFNLVLPMSGLAAYVRIVRKHVNVSWSELAALTMPQFVLAVVALGVLGLVATACNLSTLEFAAIPVAGFYLALLVVFITASSGAAWLLDVLPAALSSRATEVANAARKLAGHPNLIIRLVLIHASAILLRGGRLWMLFAAAGASLDWNQLLMLVVIVESTMLVNVTPGGLGIREVLVLGGSAVVGIPPTVSAGVALADRLLVVLMTAALTGPAFAWLYVSSRRPRVNQNAQ